MSRARAHAGPGRSKKGTARARHHPFAISAHQADPECPSARHAACSARGHAARAGSLGGASVALCAGCPHRVFCAPSKHLSRRPRPRPPPRAGVYSYNVSVQGGSWCTTSITVTACHSTVTCAEPRTLALPQDGRCATYALTQSSIYNITVVPYGVFAATVFPALPSNLVFAPGEQDPLSVLVQQKGAVGRGHSSNPPL